MPLFIKTEKFTQKTINMLDKERIIFLNEHKQWVDKLYKGGIKIFSGYVTNKNGKPGGGGLLIIEARDFKEAKYLILQDPMIKNNLVNWEINQLVPVSGDFPYINEEKFP